MELAPAAHALKPSAAQIQALGDLGEGEELIRLGRATLGGREFDDRGDELCCKSADPLCTVGSWVHGKPPWPASPARRSPASRASLDSSCGSPRPLVVEWSESRAQSPKHLQGVDGIRLLGPSALGGYHEGCLIDV